VDDNRFDLRPIFIDSNWPWQFRQIDALVKEIESCAPDCASTIASRF